MESEPRVTLILEDGSTFTGLSFGYNKPTVGEVVFNTAMTGYQESLTDPSYSGQILVFTFPLIGNRGVPPHTCDSHGISIYMESLRIHAQAIIVSDYSHDYSHWNGVESLASWLKEEQIPGIYGVDTRALAKLLREKGCMRGKIVYHDPNEIDLGDSQPIHQVAQVSCNQIINYHQQANRKQVVLVDCGVKHHIIRSLISRDVSIIRVPWDYDFTTLSYDGLFISNGPGDPNSCDITVSHIRKALAYNKPIFGICMGNQLLAKAGGASIYKLKYGHRSHNQPVRMVGSNRCYITSQNHGYAVDDKTLGGDWEPYFINMNDDTNEGIRHISSPFFSAQFHPEACGGPTDTDFLFDQFVSLL